MAERGPVEIYDEEEIKTFGRPAHLSNGGTSPAILSHFHSAHLHSVYFHFVCVQSVHFHTVHFH